MLLAAIGGLSDTLQIVQRLLGDLPGVHPFPCRFRWPNGFTESVPALAFPGCCRRLRADFPIATTGLDNWAVSLPARFHRPVVGAARAKPVSSSSIGFRPQLGRRSASGSWPATPLIVNGALRPARSCVSGC